MKSLVTFDNSYIELYWVIYVSFIVCMSLGVLISYLANRYFISRVSYMSKLCLERRGRKMLDKIWNFFQFRYRRVRVGKGTQIIGKLELQGHGTVEIGENVKIYSTWRKNPVGGVRAELYFKLLEMER